MTRIKNRILTTALALSASAIVLLSGCGKAESNPKVTLAFGTYTAWNRLADFLLPSAFASVSEGKLCFKRLRFKAEDESTSTDPTADSDNIEFNPGLVSLSVIGTTLGEATLPAGTYKRIEFDLEKDCPGSASGTNSVSVTNSSGTFTSQDRVTIKFEGTFVAESSGQVIALGVQNLVTALNAATSSNDIKTKLEAASGTF